MIRITNGEVYTAKRVRSGIAGRGAWELIVVESGKDEITLWVTNTPSGVTEGGELRIKSIDSLTKKRVAYKDGKMVRDRSVRDVEWRTEVDANVTVEAVGFEECPFELDDPPFMMDDNPFETDQLPL